MNLNPCTLCGGTHYGSNACPYRCELCKVNIHACNVPVCERNARWQAEKLAIDRREAQQREREAWSMI